MITLISDYKGQDNITYDEAANICYYHVEGKVYHMEWNALTCAYEFQDYYFSDQVLLEDAINDGIFEVIHV